MADTRPKSTVIANEFHAAWLERKRTFERLSNQGLTEEQAQEAIKEYSDAVANFDKARRTVIK